MKRKYCLRILFLLIFLLGTTFESKAGAYGDFRIDGISYTIINTNEVYVEEPTGYFYRKAIKIPSIVTNNNISYKATEIGPNAFKDYTGPISVSIPNSVTFISDRAFYRCDIDSVIFEDGNKPLTIQTDGSFFSFWNASIDVLKIGRNIKPYGYGDDYGLFETLEKLKIVEFTDSVTLVSSRAFYGCNSLIKVSIPGSVTSIGESAFCGCSSLTNISIPSSVTSIGEYAFYGCSGLPKIIVNSKPYYTGCEISYSLENGNTIQSIVFNGNRNPITLVNNTNKIKLDYYWALVNGSEVYVPKRTTIPTKPFSINFYGKATGASSIHLVASKSSLEGNVKVSERINKYDEGITTMDLYGLEPSSTYTFTYYVTLTEEDINSEYTFEKKITVKTPELNLTTLPAKATSDKVALLCATTNLGENTTGGGFEWRRYDAPSLVPSTMSPCIVMDNTLTGALKNLNPNTYYKFRPYYKSDSGKMYYGEWSAFGTADAYVYFDPTVRTYMAQNVTSNGAILYGISLQGSDDIVERGFEYWKQSTGTTRTSDNCQNIAVEGDQMKASLVNLSPATQYVYRAYVKTSTSTFYGQEETFATLEGLTGIQDVVINAQKLSVLASLSGETLTMRLSGATGQVDWQLIDLNGRAVAQGQVNINENTHSVSIGKTLRGIYLLRVNNRKEQSVVKLVCW